MFSEKEVNKITAKIQDTRRTSNPPYIEYQQVQAFKLYRMFIYNYRLYQTL